MNTINAGTLAVSAAILLHASSAALADADLEVAKTVDNPTPAAGSGFEFTVSVNNSGPDSATGIEVRDTLPSGLMLTPGMSPFVSQGDYDAGTGLWQLGSLLAGNFASLTIPAIEADATTPGCIANTATIEAADQDDPDASNNVSYALVLTAGATVCARLVITAVPDVVLGTECFSDNFVADNVFFDFELRNEGPSPAANVNVKLSGTPPALASGSQPLEVEFASIAVGETVRDSVGWRLRCGSPAKTATYQIDVTSVTLLAGNSIIRIEGEVDVPGTGTCDCTVDIGVAGCFIATAAYGSPLAEEVEVLRSFRDDYLQTNTLGRQLVQWYYEVSPPLAAIIAERPMLRTTTRAALKPVVFALRYPWWTALLMLLAGLSIPIWRVWRSFVQPPR